MNFTPIVPTENDETISTELLSMAEQLCIKSATLSGSHAPQILYAVKKLLRKTNSYYSNQLAAEGTHPIDIEKAERKEFSHDPKEKKLQRLSLIHIEVQKYVETYFYNPEKTPFSKSFILDVHRELYSHLDMASFLQIKDTKNETFTKMIPGHLRQTDVDDIGQHKVPRYTELPRLFDKYESLYKFRNNTTQAEKVIYALSSYHRLIWLHPFLDGNGRTARLVLDGIFASLELEGYGLWNISRGLSRHSDKYKRCLAIADYVQQGESDGDGPLSARGLKIFIEFMLEAALEEVEFMRQNLKINTLKERIENYIRLSKEGLIRNEPLPKHSELLLKELLISEKVPRGRVQDIIHKKDRTATSLITELINMGYLESDTPKGPIRLKFNAHFASFIFPELFPHK